MKKSMIHKMFGLALLGAMTLSSAQANVFDAVKETLQRNNDSTQDLAKYTALYRDKAREALAILDRTDLSNSDKCQRVGWYISYAEANCRKQAQDLGEIARSECMEQAQKARTYAAQNDVTRLRKMTSRIATALNWAHGILSIF